MDFVPRSVYSLCALLDSNCPSPAMLELLTAGFVKIQLKIILWIPA